MDPPVYAEAEEVLLAAQAAEKAAKKKKKKKEKEKEKEKEKKRKRGEEAAGRPSTESQDDEAAVVPAPATILPRARWRSTSSRSPTSCRTRRY